MLNELSERDAMELKAKLDEAKRDFERERRPRAEIAPTELPLTDLLGRALEFTEHEREAERRFIQSRDEFEKASAQTTAAWNEYYRALVAYFENSQSAGLKHSEATQFIENVKSMNIAKGSY